MEAQPDNTPTPTKTKERSKAVEKGGSEKEQWRSFLTAMFNHKRLSRQGYGGAKLFLKTTEQYGMTERQTFTEGYLCLQQAAENSGLDELFVLGLMHEEGIIVEKNEAKAAELYERAVASHHAPSQCNLVLADLLVLTT